MRVIAPRPPLPLLDALDCWLVAGAELVLCRLEELPRVLRLPDARALPLRLLPLLRELALRLLALRLLALLRVPALLRVLPLLRLLPLLPLLRVLPLLDPFAF